MQPQVSCAAADDRGSRSAAASFRAHPDRRWLLCPMKRSAGADRPSSWRAECARPRKPPAAAAILAWRDTISGTRRSRAGLHSHPDRADGGRWKSRNRSFALSLGHRNEVNLFTRLLGLAFDLKEGKSSYGFGSVAWTQCAERLFHCTVFECAVDCDKRVLRL